MDLEWIPQPHRWLLGRECVQLLGPGQFVSMQAVKRISLAYHLHWCIDHPLLKFKILTNTSLMLTIASWNCRGEKMKRVRE